MNYVGKFYPKLRVEKKMNKTVTSFAISLLALLLIIVSINSFAIQPVKATVVTSSLSQSEFTQWQVIAEKSKTKPLNRVSLATTFTTDIEQLRTLLLWQSESYVISLPLPDGTLVDFELTPSRVVATELAEKYPQIKTFSGHQVNNEHNYGRFDITPNGFHGMFVFDGETLFIEPKRIAVSHSLTASPTTPLNLGNTNKNANANSNLTANISNSTTNSSERYISYYQKDVKHFDNSIQLKRYTPKILADSILLADSSANVKKPSDKQAKSVAQTSAVRTYRLAVSAAGEYTAYHGGSVEQTLAAIVTMVNRLNEVYQRDLSIRLELVANNDQLIFTDKTTDPFDNTSDDGGINTGVIDGIIGSENYDIGHVVSTGGGGLAVLGAACRVQYKGDGVTGDSNPINDSFYIDYVAHEIGHQFGANHTFNGTESACSGNRISSAAYEPGSASTIMSYANLCGSQNLQSHSSPYFHAKSIEQIRTYVTGANGGSCGTDSTATNNLPIVDAGVGYTIPARTPFTLTGNATDTENDTLSYSWEQFDLGAASASVNEQIDDGSRPLFRVWDPITEPVRTFPRLQDILANTTVVGETYPTTTRALNFRLMVRDGNGTNSNGGVSFDAVRIDVVDTASAFAVTSPSKADLWTLNNQTILWDVAQTTEAPIACDSVDISLSINGGQSFTELTNNEVNDGSAIIALGTVNTQTARIKIACANNIFFAINQGDFSIATTTPIVFTGQQTISVEQDNTILLTPDMFIYQSDVATSLVSESGSHYTVSENRITPEKGFNGTLTVNIVGYINNVSSDVYAATITVTPPPIVLNITGQRTLSVNQGESLTLSPDMFNYEKDTATSLIIQAGNNYSVSGTTVTPIASFSGSLTVGIISQLDGIQSPEYLATITVVATPIPPTNSGSSGGASMWLLSLLFITFVPRCLRLSFLKRR